MAHRYFAQQITDTTAVVTGDEARHLCRVMRIKTGDALILCDKSGFDYQCIAEEISESQIAFSILSNQKTPAEPSKELVVYMALPKGDKFELIV